MPELPEVETVRLELEPWLRHTHISHAALVDAPEGKKYANLTRCIGQEILAVQRRGKFLILPLSQGDELIIHLGMTGILTPKMPEKHLRVKLELHNAPTLYFQDTRRFGRFLVVAAGDYQSLPTLHTLGIEPFDADFTPEYLAEQLSKSRSAIKTYLLSQKPVAGLGNIYADEVLWRVNIHPRMPSKAVPQSVMVEMRDAIVDILQKSIEAQGTTLNDYRTVSGEVGAYLEQLHAYGHAGEPCGRCGVLLEREVIGGRSSHFCPQCQKL